jgi:branched-chain amino acid transport system ATP-binding protein
VLEILNLDASYDFLQVLWAVSLHVAEGEFVALVGPNGAGKTTTLRTVAGLLAPTRGAVLFCGQRLNGLTPDQVSRLGISFVSEALNLFPAMSVHENLLLGAYTVRDSARRQASLDYVFELFPRLYERRDQLAGTLSGGERKMLAIGRGIMPGPPGQVHGRDGAVRRAPGG